MEPREWMKYKQEILQKNELTQLIQQSNEMERRMLKTLSHNEVYDYMISKINFCQRKQVISCADIGLMIQVGDICFIDYGLAYLWETGYQHFGLVLSIVNGKAFVVPVSGSSRALSHVKQKEHMMDLGMIPGLNKPSVLYINDSKWINTARIIDVKAYINPNSNLFKRIKQTVRQMI